jgi:hypothetical protein
VKIVLSGEGADELFAGYSYPAGKDDGKRLKGELADIAIRLLDTNLRRADRMSMAHGLFGYFLHPRKASEERKQPFMSIIYTPKIVTNFYNVYGFLGLLSALRNALFFLGRICLAQGQKNDIRSGVINQFGMFFHIPADELGYRLTVDAADGKADQP